MLTRKLTIPLTIASKGKHLGTNQGGNRLVQCKLQNISEISNDINFWEEEKRKCLKLYFLLRMTGSSVLPPYCIWVLISFPCFQGSRLDDQRCAPPPAATKGPTVPDEDFFSLILRSQAKRMDEQRVLLQRDQNRDTAFGLKDCLQSDALLEFKSSGRK